MKKEKVQIIDQSPLASSSSTKKRPCALEFEEISKYFGVPINEAAKQMNVGVTMLKKRCRELNIMRWPRRKIKSLQMVIDSVKVYLATVVYMSYENDQITFNAPELKTTFLI